MVVGIEMSYRKPEGSNLVVKAYEQWNVPNDNFNLRSLKLY
jgi:hypothetical protein